MSGVGPSSLVLSRDGNFYGTTDHGGDNNQGIFFRMTPAGDLTQLNSFGGANGPNPSQTPLVEGVDGNFYGVIYSSGGGGLYPPHPNGAIVRIMREGAATFFADFAPSGASFPISLTAGSNGQLYGVTADGNPESGGSVFSVDPTGQVEILGRFPAPYQHYGTLVEASDGNLYGVIRSSGIPDNAQLFKVTPAGAISVFHNFDNTAEGASPGDIIVGADGALYGSTFAGGAENKGAVYRITLSGEVTVLHNQGFYNLVLASDGNFYGTTSIPKGRGILPDTLISRITPESVTPLYNVTNAYLPDNFAAGPNGDLYGTTFLFERHPGGAIFRLDSAGNFAFVFRFRSTSGDFPASALVEHANGKLYGTTVSGGTHNLGSVFAITPAGESATVANFRGHNGRNPQAALIRASDGNFYGTTAAGGENDSGTVFRVSPAGELRTIFSFPAGLRLSAGPLVEGGDGKLYGTLLRTFDQLTGARISDGSIFRISTSGGDLTTIPISNGDASDPAGGLVRGSDGELYGLTTGGVRSFQFVPGTVYRVTAHGTYTTIASLTADEGRPIGELVPSADGVLYAQTTPSVLGNPALIIRLTSDGVKTTLYRFESTAGGIANPFLTLGSDGNLYFPTGVRNLAGYSRILRITPQGIASVIATYDDPGIVPSSKLVETSDHHFYGTTTVQSTSRWRGGTVYRVRLLAPKITSVTPAGSGAQVVISGSSFTAATRVTFRGVAAETFSVDSDVQITATVPAGTDVSRAVVTTPTGIATFPSGSVPPGPALNISTRVKVGTADNALVGGFIIRGELPKKVIVRAIGPSLASPSFTDALLNPTLGLHGGSGEAIAFNDDWVESPQQQEISDTRIPPSDSREAAIIATLAAGNYTAVMRGASETQGIGLVEVYDLEPASGRLANISTRGLVQTGNDVMIGGFIIGGEAPAKALLRAIGPSLANGLAPVSGALADPQIELRDAEGNLMASNDNWQESPQRQEIEATTIAPSDLAEAAILATLNPGNYTAIVSGVDGTSGIALVEVYKLD